MIFPVLSKFLTPKSFDESIPAKPGIAQVRQVFSGIEKEVYVGEKRS